MKVAFISMSGVRVRTKELNELGVSLPGFLERGKVIASLPSLAGITLAALTPPDVQLDYLEVDDVKQHGLLQDYDLIAFSTFTAMANECYALSDAYRKLGIKTIIGGLHATLVPMEAAKHCDSICTGEGETLWPQILADAKRGQLKSWYSEPKRGSYDITQTPVPRFDMLELDRYNRVTVQTSRGCPLDCEFCASSKIYGAYRIKPVEQVMREIDAIKALWKNPFIELADDNTFVNKKWGKEFLRELVKRDVRWFTETDVSIADDPEMLDLLADSGCQQILVGFESVNADSFEELDRADWKKKRFESYSRVIDAAQSRGITVNGCFILGLDSDTSAVFEATRDFIKQTKLLESQVTVWTPFPGTRLYDRLKAEGRLLKDEYWDRCTLFDVNFRPKRMSVEELEAGMRWLFKELYNERFYLGRKRHYMEIQKKLLAQGLLGGALPA